MNAISKNVLWAAVIILLIGGFFLWQNSKPKQSGALKHVTVGIQTSPAMALVMVAKDKGFFAAQGLDVELKEFTGGKFALEAFLGGSLDFSISGELPVTLAVLQGNTFVVPAQVVRETKNEVRVVARRDGDLETPEAYFKAKKRTLATSFGGGPEFFTFEFLNKLGIHEDQIEIISQKPGDMPAALISGSIDAIAIFDPFAFIAERQMGEKAITFTDEDIYSELYVIEAKESVRENPVILKKFLSGLLEAEKFTKENPEEAKKIVIAYTMLNKETIDGIWNNFDFRIALTPQLLEIWKREAQWAIDTGKVRKETVIPDFRDIIFAAPLKNIAPHAVEL
ncbi:ABC transporter substrate-binding protein [Patescibacteria group bacterium]|nr:ABC transporter substrate-binding protein [Patescibacteria group bacterium]